MNMSFLSCDEQDMTPGVKQAMHLLYHHQHPASCEDQQFLIVWDHPWGLGSMLAVAARQLEISMALNRVLLSADKGPPPYDSSGNAFYDKEYCKGERFWPCYFLPITNCSLSAAELAGAKSLRDYFNDSILTNVTTVDQLRALQKQLAVPRVVLFNVYLLDLAKLKPPKLDMWFEACLPGLRTQIHLERFLKLYIMRWNTRTLIEMDKRRQEIFKDQAILPGTMNVHVRRGDKAIEMALATNDDFLTGLEGLRRYGNYTQVFVSTEDSDFIENATDLIHPSLRVLFTEVPRYSIGRENSPMKHAKTLGPAVEVMNNFVNLVLAASCDGFVGQMGSNWVTLINDFRNTVHCKRDQPFVNLHLGYGAKLRQDNFSIDRNWWQAF